jgi:hypothetical protein
MGHAAKTENLWHSQKLRCVKTEIEVHRFPSLSTHSRLFNEIINANSQNQPSINATTDITA